MMDYRKRLRYEPGSGDFYWLNGRNSGRLAGSIYGNGYRYIIIKNKPILAHRLAFWFMEGRFPPADADHINGNRADNRWENLRHATRKVNSRNHKRRATNTSGITGVDWRKDISMWVARIYLDEGRVYLGKYDNLLDAAAARISAEKKAHGYTGRGR